MARTGSGNEPGFPLLVIILVFLLTRLAILPLPSAASDVSIYAKYAREQARAERLGVSFYDFHAGQVGSQAEQARAAGTLPAPIDEYRDVEYPPLALVVMRLPSLWMHVVPGNSFEVRYSMAFRAGMAIVDGGLFLLLVVLARRLYLRSGRQGVGYRLLLYMACTLVLWHQLYDRLDLIQAFLVLLSLTLLTSRLHYFWSYAVLALAILFKLVPVVLVPLWVIASMPANRPLQLRRPRVLAGLALRTALLLGLVVVGFAPFYLRDGPGSLGFLTYHRARPIEIGSLYASFPLALRLMGHPVAVSYSYGSINLDFPLMPTLVALCPWLTAGVLLAATVLATAQFRRLSEQPAQHGTLASTHPRQSVSYVLLFLMLFIATSKVFSTQYLLWLAPLVTLLPLRGRGLWLFGGAFLLVCILSTVLVPFLFVSDLIDLTAPPPAHPLPWTLKEPTVRLAAVLLVRNLLFLGLAVGLAVHLIRNRESGVRGLESPLPPS
jgi:hypothetical protein